MAVVDAKERTRQRCAMANCKISTTKKQSQYGKEHFKESQSIQGSSSGTQTKPSSYRIAIRTIVGNNNNNNNNSNNNT
jgi:hypothetical protein